MLLICACLLAACISLEQSETKKQEVASVEGADSYRIGVIVYSNTDEEVVAFRKYLENYIGQVFPGISFIYSDGITTEEDELAFIQSACDEGVNGFMSFLSMDLKKEVDLCAKNQAYYILSSGTVSDQDFAAVEDNPWFIGVVGPGREMEYETGADMAGYFFDRHYGNRYFILSGGSGLGNEMHLRRTIGILDRLQEKYGVSFDQSSEEIAHSQKPVHVSAGDLNLCVMPGYISREEYYQSARKEYEKDRYEVVLSVLPTEEMSDVTRDAVLGVIDCYSERNLQLFNRGQLAYVAGKYSSIIGPSFAAMYNAVTGYADDFREKGKAFKLTQGFWVSSDPDDYVEKYGLANSVVNNAYNYEDLGKVCKVYNPEAGLEDLRELTEACSIEDARARRGK